MSTHKFIQLPEKDKSTDGDFISNSTKEWNISDHELQQKLFQFSYKPSSNLEKYSLEKSSNGKEQNDPKREKVAPDYGVQQKLDQYSYKASQNLPDYNISKSVNIAGQRGSVGKGVTPSKGVQQKIVLYSYKPSVEPPSHDASSNSSTTEINESTKETEKPNNELEQKLFQYSYKPSLNLPYYTGNSNEDKNNEKIAQNEMDVEHSYPVLQQPSDSLPAKPIPLPLKITPIKQKQVSLLDMLIQKKFKSVEPTLNENPHIEIEKEQSLQNNQASASTGNPNVLNSDALKQHLDPKPKTLSKEEKLKNLVEDLRKRNKKEAISEEEKKRMVVS